MNLQPIFTSVRNAGRKLAAVDTNKTDDVLRRLAEKTLDRRDFLLAENRRDLERMPVEDPRYDRLKLTDERLESIAHDILQVRGLPSPLGRILEERHLPNGLHLQKVSVPLGVIGIVYEARPNVTFDVFSLCLKSGNAVLLKGGSDAAFSNAAIIGLIKESLAENGLDTMTAELLPPDRQSTLELLQAVSCVDLVIPRGSQQLIDFVRENSRVPVIETGAGIVHTYIDAGADTKMAAEIIFNAKTRRVSVCNALDCLLVHRNRLPDLGSMLARLAERRVVLFADTASKEVLKDKYPPELLEEASEEHYGTEFLSYKMAVKTVDDLEQALEHIARYSSRHSEAVVSSDAEVCEQFLQKVDAAAVYVNTSTAFTDGAQFGMGAEIGISTQKLHARGPMALPELCSYKWLIRGLGQVRNP